MPLLDTTDYQFATPTRRLLIRHREAAPGATLAEVARQYADQITAVLRASDVRISPETPQAHGAAEVTATATVPANPAQAGGTPLALRTAFLRFPDGSLVELSLEAATTDTDGDAEFRRLVESVRPAPATPAEGVARSLAAGPAGSAGHPIGPFRIDLTPDYLGPARFTLASSDGLETYHLARSAVAELPTKSARVGTILSAGVAETRSEDGRPERYEAGVRPRLSPHRQAPPPPRPLEAVRGTADALPPSGPGETVVEGDIRGTPVRIRVSARKDGSKPRELAENLLRELNQ
jgi:hypothetical protein